MADHSQHDLLRRAAQRAAETRAVHFLAGPLLSFAASEGLSDDQLAEHLGCSPSDLPALLLCRRPQHGSHFSEHAERIATRFGVDAARLADVLRLEDALDALRTGANDERSRTFFAAARDRGDAPATDRDDTP